MLQLKFRRHPGVLIRFVLGKGQDGLQKLFGKKRCCWGTLEEYVHLGGEQKLK